MFEEIEVSVTGFFATHHSFDTATGHWGTLSFPAFSDQATFCREDGHKFVMRKVHWLGSTHEMLAGDSVCSTADRTGLLSQDLKIDFDGNLYRLLPEGILKDGWYLTDAAGMTQLEIRLRGILREGAYLTINSLLDRALVAFAYYLVHTRRQEEAAAVAATTAATAN